MVSTVITLLATTTAQDANGIWQETQTARKVFCKIESISQSEFFEAGRNGLKPEQKFIMFSGDYRGEEIIEFKGKSYAVYRTFQRGDQTELYCERKGGTNGKDAT